MSSRKLNHLDDLEISFSDADYEASAKSPRPREVGGTFNYPNKFIKSQDNSPMTKI